MATTFTTMFPDNDNFHLDISLHLRHEPDRPGQSHATLQLGLGCRGTTVAGSSGRSVLLATRGYSTVECSSSCAYSTHRGRRGNNAGRTSRYRKGL